MGEAEPAVRAVVLTSSRARDDESVDEFSDYDVIVVVSDPQPFADDLRWHEGLGRPMARWGDEGEVLGARTHFRSAIYEDGTKVDCTIWPVELLGSIVGADRLPDVLDVGYRVLVDKDRATTEWPAPTFRAHVPSPPTEAEYLELLNEFWWETSYVAKSLRRGEVFFAKFALDCDIRFGALRRLLEWRIELDHDWSLRPGVVGRGFERLLPPAVVAALEGTYAGAGIDENWAALFGTAELFAAVAHDVGDALAYDYPVTLHEWGMGRLRTARDGGTSAP